MNFKQELIVAVHIITVALIFLLIVRTIKLQNVHTNLRLMNINYYYEILIN